MRFPLISLRVFVFLLLAVAGSAFAQAEPPFTISFTQAEYSAMENANPSFKLTHTGTVPSGTIVKVDIFRRPGPISTFPVSINWTGEGMSVSTPLDVITSVPITVRDLTGTAGGDHAPGVFQPCQL
jgi:hypothetical protein